MGANVEFRTVDSVMEAFRLHETPYFAVFQGTNLKFGNEENDIPDAERILEQNLRWIEDSGTTAVYTLKVYKNIPITNKTPYKGSFTFKLDNRDLQQINTGNGQPPVYVINGQNRAVGPAPIGTTSIEAKLDKMIELITLQMQMNVANKDADEYEDDDDEEEEDEDEILMRKVEKYTTMGTVIADKITPIIGMIFQHFAPVKQQPPQPAYQQTHQISGIPMGNEQQPQQGNQLAAAIQTIVECVGEPAFVNAMMKLANMAQTEPTKLKGLLTML